MKIRVDSGKTSMLASLKVLGRKEAFKDHNRYYTERCEDAEQDLKIEDIALLGKLAEQETWFILYWLN